MPFCQMGEFLSYAQVMPTVVNSSGFIPAYVVLIIAAASVWASYSPINTWPQMWLAKTGYATGYGGSHICCTLY